MATAEFAVAIPALLLVVLLSLSAVTTVVDQVRCVDAARATARLLARGDAETGAVAEGRRLAPDGATVVVAMRADDVSVRVASPPRAGLGWLGSRASPTATAVAAREDTPP
jgi:hypothetical protein